MSETKTLCKCASCRRGREADTCRCCEGSRRVLSATGELRPCSRCQTDDFMRWADEARKDG